MSKQHKILLAEDDLTARETLAEEFSDLGFEVFTAADGFEALSLAEEKNPDLLITDLKMPKVDGLELVEKLSSKMPIILMTAYGTVSNAVKAMEMGAFSFIEKPVDWKHLLALTKKALQLGMLQRENASLKNQLEDYAFKGFVGKSPAMQEVFAKIRKVAATDKTVLVTGESGTGKELVVAAIQSQSARAKGPFIKLNCAAIPETLLESELFGHERGAFTGAAALRKGKFELADGGTLLLDEIAEMKPELQSKLLRVLQDGEFTRLGGSKTLKADVRLLCATNADLQERIKKGLFREDLYYRVGVFSIALPPLRERAGDVLLLANYFLSKSAAKLGKDLPGFSKETEEALENYSWPGNVRQLQNAVEYAGVMSEPGAPITPADLPSDIAGSYQKTQPKKISERSERPETATENLPPLSLKELEKRAILEALKRCDGNKVKAAKELGIGLKTVYRKLEEYGVEEK